MTDVSELSVGQQAAGGTRSSAASENEASLPGATGVFEQAVAALEAPAPRAEIELSPLRAPSKLAPQAHALAAEAHSPTGELTTARLVLLYDPDGHEAWQGQLRLVAYVRAGCDSEVAGDPLLPTVGWSWLTDALTNQAAPFTALGGTVTLTSSARFGDIAGPARNQAVELRASWTALDSGLEPHSRAFYELVANAAGLPPVGMAVIPGASPA